MITLSEDRGSMQAARASLAALPGKMLEGARVGLNVHGTRVLVLTQIRVPVRTGLLRSTGRMKPAILQSGRLVVQLAYGGAAGGGGAPTPHVSKRGHAPAEGMGAYYAIYVHEILDAKHAPPTGAKFLEGPAVELAPKMPEAVRVAIDARLIK